jgi:hypothetical protein
MFAHADLDKNADYGVTPGTKLCAEPEANLVTSLAIPQNDPNVLMHKPQLDLDVPHQYRPSSTKGNGHLLIDVPVPWEKYVQWLELSAEIGIIQTGWVNAAKVRGFTSLRKEGVKKTKDSASNPYPDPAKEDFNDPFGLKLPL